MKTVAYNRAEYFEITAAREKYDIAETQHKTKIVFTIPYYNELIEKFNEQKKNFRCNTEINLIVNYYKVSSKNPRTIYYFSSLTLEERLLNAEGLTEKTLTSISYIYLKDENTSFEVLPNSIWIIDDTCDMKIIVSLLKESSNKKPDKMIFFIPASQEALIKILDKDT